MVYLHKFKYSVSEKLKSVRKGEGRVGRVKGKNKGRERREGGADRARAVQTAPA